MESSWDITDEKEENKRRNVNFTYGKIIKN